jgi:hypothetical protein
MPDRAGKGGSTIPETGPSRGAARAHERTDGRNLMFDLAEQLRQLRAEHYRQSGRNPKTVVQYPHLRIVLNAIQVKTTLPPSVSLRIGANLW